ncbi:MAG: NUDIX domain-containing protein [Ruminococcaceae bacterium]|nr:NUDIX domain-containing protein [Oscillospiraceae bacterium]
MNITFKTESGVFNYRVCAIIKHNNKLLAMKNNNTPYYFLPGGRVKLHEDADAAINRELKEELGIYAKNIKPLWFVQNFFIEDEIKEKFHEICLYYLVDVSDTDLISHNRIIGLETKNNEIFEWLEINTLKEQYLYPLFIKERINDLPEQFEMLTEYEY